MPAAFLNRFELGFPRNGMSRDNPGQNHFPQKTGKGCSKAEKDVLRLEIIGKE